MCVGCGANEQGPRHGPFRLVADGDGLAGPQARGIGGGDGGARAGGEVGRRVQLGSEVPGDVCVRRRGGVAASA